jgi:predicted AlkP superfamily pyrophosphatase or phosphodiesterase
MRRRAVLFTVVLAGSLFLLLPTLAPRTRAAIPARPPRPKLGVVLVFDQMRGDYLLKWHDLFGEGGFKRLASEGAWFVNCHYPYSDTVTAAGHTSLLTGCTPHEHGIIGNDWYDRSSGRRVKAVSGTFGPDPERRQRETLGDALLRQTKGKARVAGLSIKDRAAILMAALRAQMVYWLGDNDGFTTSSYYRREPHDWVTQFNQAGKVKAYLGQSWNRLNPRLDYQKYSGPDNAAFEGTGYDQGRTFPHATPSIDAVECSPFGNNLLLDFAKTAIEKAHLGQNDVPDLLCISFSANDLIGHSYGPDSQEVLDITLRSDLIVKELLEFLDAKVGKGNYFVALSADHGICPLPEVAREHEHRGAARVLSSLLSTQAEEFLRRRFGPTKGAATWLEATSSSWVYLNRSVIRQRGLEPAVVEQALAGWLVKQPGVLAAYTRSQLSSDRPLTDPVAEQVRQSFHPQRSGDIMVVLKPYHILWSTPATLDGGSYTTTHGSPHSYDTHVPLLVYGPGIRPGIHKERVAPQALTAIMARGLNIEPPTTARFAVPAGLFTAPDVTRVAAE